MPYQSVHVRLTPALLAELDRRRKALDVPASRNAYASLLVTRALGPVAASAPPEPTGPEALAHPWQAAQTEARKRDGARLKAAREAAELSQRELAAALRVAPSQIARVETGQRAISPAMLAWVERQEKGGGA